MAVIFIAEEKRWLGLSTDTKPTPTGTQAGSTFYELDTGKKWLWDGSYWGEDLALIYALAEAFNL
jgi:hypothetical protein